MNETREFAPSDQLIAIADAFLRQVRKHEAPSIDAIASQHPSCAEEIRRYLPLVLSMEKQSVAQGDDAREEPADLPISSDQLPLGLNRYQVRRLIGCGNMGAVYEAHDLELDRLVALKIPQLDQANRQAIERFYREARAMATVDHPHICSIFDVAEIKADDLDEEGLQSLAGRPYLTMALIAGTPLSQLIDKDRVWACDHAAQLVAAVASALHAAHVAGVVHRDIKPANILIDAAGKPVVMDFGLARREQSEEVDITLDGQIIGSPAYMSPEQINYLQHVGPASDIYSLGVVLYELVCGTRPFTGSQLTLLRDICWSTPPDPSQLRPDIDPGMEAICLKAIAKDPAARYATAADLAADLEALLQSNTDSLIATRKASQRRLGPKHAVVAGLAGCLLLASVLSWPSWRTNRQASNRSGAAVVPQVVEPTPAISVAPLRTTLDDIFWQHFQYRRFETQEPDISNAYRHVFSTYGITPEETSARGLETLLQTNSAEVQQEILVGLESWLCCVARSTEDVPVPWLRSLLEFNHAEQTPIRTAILELDRARLSVLIHQYAMEHYDGRLPVIWSFYLRRSDRENTKLLLLRATEAFPDNVWVLAAEGLRRKDNGNHIGAARSLQAVLGQREPAAIYTHLSMSLLNQRKHGKAIAAARRAIELDPDDGTARFVLGKALLWSGQPEEAAASLEQAIEMKSAFAGQAYRFAATALVRSGQSDEAIAAAHAAIAVFRERTASNNILRVTREMLDELERIDEHGFQLQRFRFINEYLLAAKELRQARRIRPYIVRLLGDLKSVEDAKPWRIARLEKLLTSLDRNRR